MHDILVIGIATVDAIARPIDSIPNPGGLTNFSDLTLTTGGCAINVAIALARLGFPSQVIARVGPDMPGDFVLSELTRHGIDTSGIMRDAQRNTAFTFVAVDTLGSQRFFHTAGANASLCPDDIPEGAFAGRRFVLITGAMLMASLDGAPTAALLRDARDAGAITLLDTVFVETATEEEWQQRVAPALPMLDYFIPSFPEARALTGLTDPRAMARTLQSAGARNVIIKMGERGALCRDAHDRQSVVPACPVTQIVDATGAGDCWSAGFIVGLRGGLPITDAARLGNAVAAHCIQSPGATTGIPTLAEVNLHTGRS